MDYSMAKTKRKNRPKYSGLLAQPIPIKTVLKDLTGDAPLIIHDDVLSPIYREKLEALSAFYGVMPDTEQDLVTLIFRMARAHVPGFSLVHSGGRPVKWTDEKKRELYRQVTRLKQEMNLANEEAISLLTERGAIYEKDDPASLFSTFRIARREQNRISKEADALLEELSRQQ